MKWLEFWSFGVFLVMVLLTEGKVNARLLYSSMVFRHGDRTPISLYPADPYKSHVWREGLGQLTNSGKILLYKLGLWLKDRYKDQIILDHYDLNTIVVNSSDVDRAIMSAQCLLAAMYTPHGDELWNPNITWQPIPVHTIPKPIDNIISFSKPCDNYEIELESLLNIPEVENYFTKYEKLFDFVSSKSGMKFTGNSVYDFDDLLSLYSALSIEEDNGLELPEWAKKNYKEIKKAASLALWLFSYTPELQRFRGGPILKDIVNLMIAKRDGTLIRNVTLYSGHDYLIATLLNTLGAPDTNLIPYGAAILIELYYVQNEHIVKIYYKNSTEGPLKEIILNDCFDQCTLDRFVSSLNHLLPGNWDKECAQTDGVPFTIFIIFALAIFLVMFIIIRYYIQRWKRKQNAYEAY